MTPLALLVAFTLPVSFETFDLPVSATSVYHYVYTPREGPVEEPDWSSNAPVIRTPEQYNMAKEKQVPIIRFQGSLFYLNEENAYQPNPPLPTPVTESPQLGIVAFFNGSPDVVHFVVYRKEVPRARQNFPVLPYSESKVRFPLGPWQYEVEELESHPEWPGSGEFIVDEFSTTHVLFGYPGRNPLRAKNWMARDGEVLPQRYIPGNRVTPEEADALFRLIPRYPGALETTLGENMPNYILYRTQDPPEKVIGFYRDNLLYSGWDVLDSTGTVTTFLRSDRKLNVEVLDKPGQWHRVILSIWPLRG